MSLPFARSERSLQTDDYRTALICGLIALPLFVGWLVWFFASDLPVRKISQDLSFGDYDTLVANFTLEEMPHLQPGDAAWLRLQLPGEDHLTTIPATVADIRQRSEQVYAVYLYPADEFRNILSLPSLSGQAEVDVDDRSPFRVLLQPN